MRTEGNADEFEVLGPRKRTVKLGDVFAWRLSGSHTSYAGQVLDVETDLAGAKLILVAFFDVKVDDVRSRVDGLDVARMIGQPFITNRTGWFDGFFVTIANAPPVDLGRVGVAKLSGEIVDLRGRGTDRNDFDLVIRHWLSPPGAIARLLAHSG